LVQETVKPMRSELLPIQRRKLILVIVLGLLCLAIIQLGADADYNVNGSKQTATNGTKLVSLIQRPTIWAGKLQYYGESKEQASLVSTAELLYLYTDEELQGVLELYISSARLLQIEGLNRLPNLRTLDLVGNRIATISGIEGCPLLEIINLSQNWIERMEGLESLPYLRELYLANNRVKRIEGLESLKNLEVLMLEGNQITEIAGLSDLPALRRLGLAGNRLRDVSRLLELGHLQEISIESLYNELDEKAMEIINDWNHEHPTMQLRWR
jgi:Leucine-rich repeat (LRR) protein